MPPANKAHLIRSLLLGSAFVAPLFAVALIRTNIWIALAPMFFSHMFQLYATLVPGCTWWGPVVRNFRTDAREVWITIDDGPSAEHTLKMLEVLDQFRARATFFVIGQQAEKHPHLITEILARGHELANHTFTHPSVTFWISGPMKIAREIAHCANFLRTNPSRPARFFRAPAGTKNPFVHPALQYGGLHLIGWSARGFDTRGRAPEKVAASIVQKTRPGGIVLLHEGNRSQRDPDYHARCLALTLQALAEDGYQFVIPTAAQLGLRDDEKEKADC